MKYPTIRGSLRSVLALPVVMNLACALFAVAPITMQASAQTPAQIPSQSGAPPMRPAQPRATQPETIAPSRPASAPRTASPVTVTNLPGDAPARVDQRAIDASIAEDASVTAALASYRTRVAELNKPIARLAVDIEKRGIGGGSVGNLVADAMRAEASRRAGRPVPFAIVNTGGLRKNAIGAGALTTSDIYELLPFDNMLVLVELTGEQLSRLLAEVTKARDAQTGAAITFTADADDRNTQLVSATLYPAKGKSKLKGQAIAPTQTYLVATIDYLVNRGGNYAVLKEARRVQPLDVTLRDAVIEHLRRETAAGRAINPALDNRFRRAQKSNHANAARAAQGGAAQ